MKMKKAAHCDTSTGKIYGCKKGSFAWWHEKGHIVFNNSYKGSKLILLQSYIFYFWMLYVSLSLFFNDNFLSFFTLLFLSLYFSISFYEEMCCNKYAREHIK
jgi:hypothetical protein